MEGSPAIDSGVEVDLKIDLEGGARPTGKGFDIGAYEYGSKPFNYQTGKSQITSYKTHREVERSTKNWLLWGWLLIILFIAVSLPLVYKFRSYLEVRR